MHVRNCPECNVEITYSTKYTKEGATRRHSLCKKCAFVPRDISGVNNPFYGKKHSKENCDRQRILSTGRKHSDESKNKNRIASTGSNNPMYNKSFYEIWLEKYGKEIADEKMENFKAKQTKAQSGKNNPMYGKPSPRGSGNGWKGWYKGTFFRSLMELSFLVNYVDRFKMKMENGEKAKYAITYKDYQGTDRTYFPDYIINNKYMVEVKPKKLINTPLIKAKSKAAIKFCKKNGLKYKILSPILIDIRDYTKHIKFTEKSEIRKDNYFGS